MARSAAWTPCGRWSTLDAAAVAILIDAPFNHPQQGRVRGDISLTPGDCDEQIQLIVDLRRAMDLLTVRPDVDRRRLA
jgi:hypothetical protein